MTRHRDNRLERALNASIQERLAATLRVRAQTQKIEQAARERAAKTLAESRLCPGCCHARRTNQRIGRC